MSHITLERHMFQPPQKSELLEAARPVRFVNVGDICMWHSSKGYTLPAGERAEVYQVDKSIRRAAINLPGDAQTPDGYSMSVSFDELFPIA